MIESGVQLFENSAMTGLDKGTPNRVRTAGGQPRDVAVTVRTPKGDPGAALTSIATRHGDVIVVGRENLPGWRRVRHGSVSRYCRSHAGCPVVVVPIDQESL